MVAALRSAAAPEAQAIPIVQAFNVDETMNNINEAKDAFQKMLKDKNKWGVLFLILVILFVIWLLFLYIREKLNLQVWNNNTMVNSYKVLDGPSIGQIGNVNKFLLRSNFFFNKILFLTLSLKDVSFLFGSKLFIFVI